MITTTTRQESHQHQDTFKIVENTANKIECTKILEKVDECRYEMTTAASQADDYIQSAQDYNRELQNKLNNANIKANELKNKYNGILEKKTQYQQDNARRQDLIKIDQEKSRSLKAEIELLTKQSEQIEHAPLAGGSMSNHDQLQLALFRGMGIEMKVEDDRQVKKAILSSPDQQDILTFPLEEFTAEFTANHIWDFISKGL